MGFFSGLKKQADQAHEEFSRDDATPQMSAKQYKAFVRRCSDELKRKHTQLIEEYNLTQYQDCVFDPENGLLQYRKDGKVKLEFTVVVIGSLAPRKRVWIWGWANDSVKVPLRQESARLKELTNLTGFKVFSNGTFKAEDTTAFEFTCIAVQFLGARAMYIDKQQKGTHTYIALMEAVKPKQLKK